jgi:putative transposase
MTNLFEKRVEGKASDFVKIDGDQVRQRFDELVRSSVEATLNAMLDAEADELCRAKRYERSPDRMDTRSGSYPRRLQTRVGDGAFIEFAIVRAQPRLDAECVEERRRPPLSAFHKKCR